MSLRGRRAAGTSLPVMVASVARRSPCGTADARHLDRILAALAVVLLAAFSGVPGTSAQEGARNGAGLVVRHGDGTLIYAYVEFDEETISGEELLLRSGLDFVVAPYGGLGTGICAINGEGCPADDCYCESYSSPAYYWNYYARSGEGWAVQLRGPTSRQLADGDIDGWSWTAGDHGLPPVTIDEIAAITGFDRSPDLTATPTATIAPPTATSPPPPTATPTHEPSPTPTSTPVDTPVPPTETATIPAVKPSSTEVRATATATATAWPTPVAATVTSTATETPTSTASATSSPAATATATASTGAVIVRPGETAETLEPESETGSDSQRTLMIFGGFVALALVGGAVAVVRRNRSDG